MKRSQARSEEAIEFARNQRRNSNEFATTVWQWIRNREIHGVKFRREHPILPYTADFCCTERNLIIEVDGEGHFTEEGIELDRVRDRFLKNLGYRILRIPGYAVIREGDAVITSIRDFVRESREG
jgi:very-short-patch-repair endonuclease